MMQGRQFHESMIKFWSVLSTILLPNMRFILFPRPYTWSPDSTRPEFKIQVAILGHSGFCVLVSE